MISRVARLDRQVLDLVFAVRPNAEGVRALVRAGHAVSVDIAGTAETGSGMSVPPALLEALATLDLPVSFTCLSGAGEPANDPMSRLDEWTAAVGRLSSGWVRRKRAVGRGAGCLGSGGWM
ncbi:hypothetical protein ABT237_11990 [Streptomyces sp. NPDC001581]|uniref:hypothetical protein n=1 Tax=Streptomyces sp. NPDC001581 TaxID=3154386 RepID=UPI00332FB25F